MSVLKVKLSLVAFNLLNEEVHEDLTMKHPLAPELADAFERAQTPLTGYREVQVSEDGAKLLLGYLETYRDEREVTDAAIARGELSRHIYSVLPGNIQRLEHELAAAR